VTVSRVGDDSAVLTAAAVDPLTAVHIVGLLLATVLTLVMLPTLYYVFCAKLKFIK